MFSVKYFANELCYEDDQFAEPVLCCTVHTQKEAFDAGCIYQKKRPEELPSLLRALSGCDQGPEMRKPAIPICWGICR
jgi:hypothetical protein